MENRTSDQLQKIDPKPLDTVPFYTPIQQDLERKVHQIALREGLSSQPFTSIAISTTRRTPSPQSPSHCHITASEELDSVQSTDQMRLQPAVIFSVSGREKVTARKEQHGEEMTDKNKENIVTNDPQIIQRIPHMDKNVTSSNQILSSAASDSTFGKTSHLSRIHVTLSPKQQSNPNYLSRVFSQNTSKDVPPPMVSGMTGEHPQSIHRISKSKHARSYEHREPVQGQNAGSVSAHLQARNPQNVAPSQRLAGTSRSLSVQAGI